MNGTEIQIALLQGLILIIIFRWSKVDMLLKFHKVWWFSDESMMMRIIKSKQEVVIFAMELWTKKIQMQSMRFFACFGGKFGSKEFVVFLSSSKEGYGSEDGVATMFMDFGSGLGGLWWRTIGNKDSSDGKEEDKKFITKEQEPEQWVESSLCYCADSITEEK